MEASEFLICTRCTGRIGTYEPMWWRHPDGTVVDSSYLRLRDHPLREESGAEFFHAECLKAPSHVAGT